MDHINRSRPALYSFLAGSWPLEEPSQGDRKPTRAAQRPHSGRAHSRFAREGVVSIEALVAGPPDCGLPTTPSATAPRHGIRWAAADGPTRAPSRISEINLALYWPYRTKPTAPTLGRKPVICRQFVRVSDGIRTRDRLDHNTVRSYAGLHLRRATTRNTLDIGAGRALVLRRVSGCSVTTPLPPRGPHHHALAAGIVGANGANCCFHAKQALSCARRGLA
jgi:hypothetical protein